MYTNIALLCQMKSFLNHNIFHWTLKASKDRVVPGTSSGLMQSLYTESDERLYDTGGNATDVSHLY